MENDHLLFIDKNAQEISLGRATAGQPIVPDVDLNDFEAYEAGVSRLHASLILSSPTIKVQDLGSVNGTRVNGKKLDPYTAAPLNNGDILTLGKLKIQILVRK
ncbi:MAG: FHA domain-containing protein [Anaerolineales bacterium]|nr:FHA domain-containing protein [Anaerolineales bacterium]